MKLLTKAWYQTMQNSGLGVQLVADDRAAEYSEELFRALWEEKLDQWMELRAELGEELDEGQERRFFREDYESNLEEYRTRTPAGILEKVADLRVLALGYCTAEVYREFREYRALCEKWTEKTLEEAWKMRCSQGLKDAWTGEDSLHDAFVRSMKWEGEDLLIEFEVEDPEERLADLRENAPEMLEEMGEESFLFPEIKAVRFRNAKILKQEQTVENAWWLYDEIWRTEEGTVEIHGLLYKDDGVFELTVECRDTELIWTIPPKTE